MEIQKLKVKEKLKISAKTKIELLQAIANLMRQNIKGRYDEKILLYRQALEQYKNSPVVNVVSTSSSDEITAIMLFNKDKRFTITE
ncbi:hypothetical protein HYN59_07135 [Flavobacterium album]|uniref:Uncharacterized protein n=1 Tax=Flavobacterium album TaxID=2175091 RepID=A0A2S1QWX9_9FLAO|nr:hypothetical protein [Flavobacterium album]AWH84912.1 hypothetical protein HYN59_07135 [Flavobacterium album]